MAQTANTAVNQGREVFSLPGPVDRLTSGGTNHLLKEGAALAESPGDILEVLALPLRRVVKPSHVGADPCVCPATAENEPAEQGPHRGAPLQQNLNPLLATSEEENILLKALSAGPRVHDEILQRLALTPATMSTLLIKLQLAKKIQKQPDGRFALVR